MKNELKRKKNQYFDKFYQIIQKMNAENDKRKKKCCELIKPPNK